MSHLIAIRLPEADVAALDEAIARGRFPNRAAALREGLNGCFGEAGLGAFAAFVEAEKRTTRITDTRAP